ncbi:hypothetical protein QAD02_000125, partial [Eretmocerus hayati]
KKSKSLRCKVPNEHQCFHENNLITLRECENRCQQSNETFIIGAACIDKHCLCHWDILGLPDSQSDFYYPLETCEEFSLESSILRQGSAVSRTNDISLPPRVLTPKQPPNHEYATIENDLYSGIGCYEQCKSAGKKVGKTITKGTEVSNESRKTCVCEYENLGCVLNMELKHLAANERRLMGTPTKSNGMKYQQ